MEQAIRELYRKQPYCFLNCKDRDLNIDGVFYKTHKSEGHVTILEVRTGDFKYRLAQSGIAQSPNVNYVIRKLDIGQEPDDFQDGLITRIENNSPEFAFNCFMDFLKKEVLQ